MGAIGFTSAESTDLIRLEHFIIGEMLAEQTAQKRLVTLPKALGDLNGGRVYKNKSKSQRQPPVFLESHRPIRLDSTNKYREKRGLFGLSQRIIRILPMDFTTKLLVAAMRRNCNCMLIDGS